jgi:inorganic triphosphatase YgiF
VDTETELKFALHPDDIDRIRAAPLLTRQPGRSKSLVSTYYDTADFALQRNAVTLRIRQDGDGGCVQTVKTAPDPTRQAAGLFARGEWEEKLPAPVPDVAVPALRERLGDLAPDALRPIFTSRIERMVWTVAAAGDAEIEVALDRGEIDAPDNGATASVCEIELELKRGSPAALYEMAAAFCEAAPLRIERRTKAERGYALARGGGDAALSSEPPQPVYATPLALDREMTVEAVLGAVLRHGLDHIAANEPAALAGHPDGVHQMRVAVRRLRSALSMLKSMLPRDQRIWAASELKWLADGLSPARNWDVLGDSLLPPVERVLPEDHDLVALSRSVAAQRKAAHEAAQEIVRSSRYAALIIRLAAWLEGQAWRQQAVSEASAQLLAPIGGLAGDLLDKRLRRVRKLGRQFDELAADERHRLRIALKELRYAVDFLHSLYDADAIAGYRKRLTKLQDTLGHANDVATAQRLFADLRSDKRTRRNGRAGNRSTGSAEDVAAGYVIGWHVNGLAKAEKKLRRQVKRLLKTDPFWRA